MRNPYHSVGLHSFDFASYVNGAVGGGEKAALEQHLCDCDDCFEILISALNQHLNTAPRALSGFARAVAPCQYQLA
jgi:hypothetical protein